MTAKELYQKIESLAGDIEFEYNGLHGAICLFGPDDISISYGSEERSHKSIENAMNDRLYSGKSLCEIADKLEMW